MVAILSRQRDAIVGAVRAMYTDVARDPTREFHFPTGRSACVFVGYPEAQLDAVVPEVLESFAGVAYPFAADAICPGDTVLDIGSGSGTDVLIAAGLAGPTGRVIGIDLTSAMLDKLEPGAATSRAAIELLHADAEALPLPDASVDVVTSNGVLNLVVDKRRAIAEMFRVLRRGGRVQIADIVLATPVSEACRSDPRLWAECVVGAVLEDDYVDLYRAAGFRDVRVLSHLDYFAGSASTDTREIAGALGARSLLLRGAK